MPHLVPFSPFFDQTDILLFQRRKLAPTKTSKKNKTTEPILPEQLEEINIEDFIVGELEHSDQKLELLDEKRIAIALDDYVQKQQAQALPETVTSLLAKQQKKLIQRGHTSDQGTSEKPAETLTRSEDEPKVAKNFKRVEPRHKFSEADSDLEDVEGIQVTSPVASSKSRPKAKPQRTTKARSLVKASQGRKDSDLDSEGESSKRARPISGKSRSRKPIIDDDESEDEFKEEVSLPVTSRRGRTGKKKLNYYAGEDSLDDSVEDDDDSPPRKKGGRSKEVQKTPASSKSGTRHSQSQLSFVPAKRNGNSNTRKRGRLQTDSDDEYQPVHTTSNTGSYDLEEDWGTAKTDTIDT